MDFVLSVIHERAKEHLMPLRKVAQHMKRPHFVALVGRVRKAMNEEEDARHLSYPRLRTMNGPMKFASHNGMRFQVWIRNRYFGLFGLFCGTLSRPKSLYS